MQPDSNPTALYNLTLCDFCASLAQSWTWLTPSPSWVFQPHSSMTKHQYNLYHVCSTHGAPTGPTAPTLFHTPVDVTHKLR